MKISSSSTFPTSRKIRKVGMMLLLVSLLSGLFGCAKTTSYSVTAVETATGADAGTIEEITLAEDGESVTTDSTDGASTDATDTTGADSTGDSDSTEGATTDDSATATSTNTALTSTDIYIDVEGAVEHPGVYCLDAGARVYEAIEKAGGLTADAYATALNQAQVLSDGMQIYVPTKSEYEAGSVTTYITGGTEASTSSSTASTSDTSSASSSSASTSATDDGKVNINTADSATLCTLTGIGETKALAIIAYREAHGDFASVSDIQNVSGIGSSTYEKIKDAIKVN